MAHFNTRTTPKDVSRRTFLKGTAAAGAAAMTAGLSARVAYAAGSDTIKVGLIGCGGRGTGAVRDCLEASNLVNQDVRIIALADLWRDKVLAKRQQLDQWAKKNAKGKFAVDEDHCFGGFDAYKQLLASGVDHVLVATPPGFRPIHFPAIIAAGKHCFMEKPVCVDPWGYNEICKAGDLAKEKELTVVAGTQRRHEPCRRECLQRIHDGAIGQLTGGQCYWRGGPVTHKRPRGEGMSDIEWQILNWYAWCWTCGDHICEQHVHNIDMICWAFGTHPESAYGIGGRQSRPEPGNIYDHFAVEYVFPGGARVASYCSHFPKSTNRIGERIVGTKGTSDLSHSIEGDSAWQFKGRGKGRNPKIDEHMDCLRSITGKGEHWNQAREVAESSMTAVLGRMSTYTGRQIKWDWAVTQSKLRLGPENRHAFGPYEPPPVAVPGQTELI